MNILPFKYVKITEGLRVRVSNHFYYSDFGIVDSSEQRYTGRRYIQEGTPGTGFIERESDSHSYCQFIRKSLAAQQPKYWRLLLGKEPSFDKELVAAGKALNLCTDQRKRQILECYHNALSIARTEERMQRIVRGIKDKIGHKSHKYLVSVMSHYKSKILHLERDIKGVVFNVKDSCSAATYAAYEQMVDAFTRVAACRRVWHNCDHDKKHLAQVYFDLGAFDYIHSPIYLPFMRDSHGKKYLFLPDSLIVARTSVDFDVLPLKDLTVIFQELSIEEPTEILSSRLGDAASMIKFPGIDLTFYFNHVRPIAQFVESIERLKATL